VYVASIRHLPTPPELVKVTGDESIVMLITNEVLSKSQLVAPAQTTEPASLEIKVESGNVTVYDIDKKRKAYVTDGTTPEHLVTVRDALDKIVMWRRLIELENANLSSKVSQFVDYELQEINEEGQIKLHTKDARISATSESMANRIPAFLPVVHVKNAQQPLYFYLFFIAFDYSISCPGGEVVYRAYEYEDKSDVKIPLWKKTLGWGPAKDNPEDTCVFKLLVTTEPLDYQQFLQSGLGIHRDILGEPTPQKLFDDWSSQSISITMVRQDNTINANQDVKLADGQITIKAHPTVNGSVSIGHAETNTRSTADIHSFARLSGANVSLVDFSPSRSMQLQNVIEIDNIQLNNEEDLIDNPIEIHLRQTFQENELMLPIAFDGEYFHVVGDAVTDGEGTKINVRSIPDRKVVGENAMGDRGILKSIRMTFCKVTLDQKDVNQLRWAEKMPDGTIALHRESLGIKVGKAKKILLVLHGLAGDGLMMTQSIFENMAAGGMDQYDLVLVYDYESLNTPLDDTARHLKSTLSDFGFGQDEKRITIISHSIGGLIARWMIEQEGGNAFIDHCILVGTPNNGSMYGRIDSYVKWAQTILDLAINFIPKVVPFSGLLLKFLKTATDLSGSLAQIDPESDFVNKLNSSKDPGIRYSVLSGDAAGIDIENNGFSGFIKTSQQRLGKYMNGNEPNDLFAPVRSLQCKELWEGRQGVTIPDPVANYHFGYFLTPGGTRDANTVWKQLNDVLASEPVKS
ncbi:MAG: alpha/beta hydrolase, partial [Bacteroidota bacterium]|nr:alpha/beta hydrolase [Bacteroidota bacterium]